MLKDFQAKADRQLHDGDSFVLNAPTTVPSVWGRDTDVLWSQGEHVIICGPQGVGKSSLMQQLSLARADALEPSRLDFPVTPADRPMLYVAADRPQQSAQSLRRIVNDDRADVLRDRLKIWAGPLPFNLVKTPEALCEMAEILGVGTVFIDSLKDIASPLSNDDVGAAVNLAFGTVIAASIELCSTHHNRKATADNRKPATLADVYGSTWITSGAGSVISLWGDAGDPLVELKQPADEVGPLNIEHDHTAGTTRLLERPTPWSALQASGTKGITAPDVAEAVYGRNPTRSQIEKIRRRLQKLADKGQATASKGTLRTDPVRFHPNNTVELRVVPRVVPRPLHGATRTPVNTDHADYTLQTVPPLLKEEAERVAKTCSQQNGIRREDAER
jgi:energy-coupling factor transporter ATP-binding protein EcfA2